MDFKDLLKFKFAQEQEQFNMTAPENLMLPEQSAPVPTPKRAPAVAPVQPSPEEAMPDSAVANPTVREYIKQKYGLLDPEAYDAQMKEAQAQADDRKSGLGIAQFIAGAGDAIAGRSPAQSAQLFDGFRKNIDDSTVGSLEKRRKAQTENLASNNMLDKMQSDKDASDPMSAKNKTFRHILKKNYPDVAASYGKDFDSITVQDREAIMDVMKLKETNDMRRDQMRILSGQKEEAKREKVEKDERERITPYGLANTVDDAKKLKEASELKNKLDAQVSELIALRKAKGAEVLNRDVVARAKQLSNDLLLTKKNLESLGVLSQSDKDIVNEIIPSDPTEFKFAQLAGQDPIMTKLEAFKKDTDNDFNGRLRTRLSDPSKVPQSSGFPKQVRKGNQTATVSNEQELKEAQSEGWQ